MCLSGTMGTGDGKFAEIGFKFGKLQDLGWWRRTLSPGPPAQEPIPFKSLAMLV